MNPKECSYSDFAECSVRVGGDDSLPATLDFIDDDWDDEDEGEVRWGTCYDSGCEEEECDF